MKLDLKQNDSYITDTMGDQVYLSKPVNVYYIMTYKHGYQSYNLEYIDSSITKDKIEKYFEPVDNVNSVSYLSNQKMMIDYKCLYKHNVTDTYIFIGLNLEKQDEWDEASDEGRYLENHYKVYKIFYKLEEENLKVILDFYNKVLDFTLQKSTLINLVIKTTTGYKFKEFEIEPLPLDIDSYYNDDFKEVHEKVTKSLNKSSKGIIMLHGKAGTGKTNYIKYLTGVVQKKKFVFIPSNMVGYLSDPGFIENLIDNKNSVLVLEDCEIYLKDRKLNTGNDNFVSSLLNISDGILSDVLSLQIICTFNNNLTSLDPALLREGRLICEYEFKELEKEKAIELMKKNNIKNRDIKEYTLAKIFNADKQAIRQKETKKIGF